MTWPGYASRVVYIGQVTFYKVPVQHDYVHLVGLYQKSSEKTVPCEAGVLMGRFYIHYRTEQKYCSPGSTKMNTE